MHQPEVSRDPEGSARKAFNRSILDFAGGLQDEERKGGMKRGTLCSFLYRKDNGMETALCFCITLYTSSPCILTAD